MSEIEKRCIKVLEALVANGIFFDSAIEQSRPAAFGFSFENLEADIREILSDAGAKADQPKTDGGAELERDDYAYPGQRFTQSGFNVGYGQGMTLRDYFAGQVLVGGFTEFNSLADLEMPVEECVMVISGAAYAIADAMIAERKEK